MANAFTCPNADAVNSCIFSGYDQSFSSKSIRLHFRTCVPYSFLYNHPYPSSLQGASAVQLMRGGVRWPVEIEHARPIKAGGPSRDDPGAERFGVMGVIRSASSQSPFSGGHQWSCLRGSAKQAEAHRARDVRVQRDLRLWTASLRFDGAKAPSVREGRRSV